MARPLHDYVKNRDSVHIVKVYADQFTEDFKQIFPSFADLPFVYQIMSSNGEYTYVDTLTKVVEYVEYAGEGRGAIRRIITGVPVERALKEAKEEYEYWMTDWFDRGKKKAQRKEQDIPELGNILDDLNVDDILGDL